MAAVGLLRLSGLNGDERLASAAEAILGLLGPIAGGHPMAFAHLLGALGLHLAGTTEIAVVGDRPELVRAVQRAWRPNAVLAWGEPYDSPLWHDRSPGLAYVCRNFTCHAPVDTVDALHTALLA